MMKYLSGKKEGPYMTSIMNRWKEGLRKKAKRRESLMMQPSLNRHRIFREGSNYYKYTNIEDKGFNKWEGAYDKTA